jgi:hypothetical protein
VSLDLAARRMAADPVRRRSLVASDLAEVVAQRLRRAVAAEAAFERCPGLGGSMAADSSAPATAAMAECRGRSGNTEAAAAGMVADYAHRRVGVAAGCRRAIRRSRRLDSRQIGPEQAPWQAVPPVARRPPTKHEMTCHAPSSSGFCPAGDNSPDARSLCPVNTGITALEGRPRISTSVDSRASGNPEGWVPAFAGTNGKCAMSRAWFRLWNYCFPGVQAL